MSTAVPITKPTSQSPPSSSRNHNKPVVANKILRKLPRKEYNAVFPRLEWVDLPVHTVLNQEAKPIEHGYFINGGLASILTVLAGGKSVEVGLTGVEGFVGLPLVAGFKSSSTRVIIQIGGSGFQFGAKDHRSRPSRLGIRDLRMLRLHESPCKLWQNRSASFIRHSKQARPMRPRQWRVSARPVCLYCGPVRYVLRCRLIIARYLAFFLYVSPADWDHGCAGIRCEVRG